MWDGFDRLFSRRQSIVDEGIHVKYNERFFLLSFFWAVGCSRESFVLTTRFIKRLPSRKATSSSRLSLRISSANESTSRISSLLLRSTDIILMSSSSRRAVRRKPQTEELHGIVLADFAQKLNSCVRSVTKKIREPNHSFSISNLSK